MPVRQNTLWMKRAIKALSRGKNTTQQAIMGNCERIIMTKIVFASPDVQPRFRIREADSITEAASRTRAYCPAIAFPKSATK